MQHFILKLVKFINIYNIIIIILWFEMLNEKKQSVKKT